MVRSNRVLVLLLALTWVPSAPVGGSTKTKRRHRRTAPIAVLLDLEGAQASIGQPAMNGFLLGLQQATEHDPIVFSALFDTETDPETTVAAAKAVARRVSLAAGFTDNDSVLIAGPYFEHARTPFLSIGATNPALPEKVGKNVFLAPFGDNTQAAAAAEFAISRPWDSVAILWDSTSNYTRTLPRYFRSRFEELGGSVLLAASYDGGCDIRPLGIQVATLSPAFIYLAGLPDCIGDVVASLRGAGVMQPIIGGDGLDTPNLLEGSLTSDVWFTTHAWLSEETGTDEAKAFIAAYRDAYGAAPADAFAALGYDAARLVLDALGRARSSRSVYRALERTTDFQGVTGTISFSSESHVPLKTVWIVEVQFGERSLATDFIPQSVPPPILDNP